MLEEIEGVCSRCVDLDLAVADQEVRCIEVRGESGSTEITEAMKAYFSNFSVERRVVEGKGTKKEKGNKESQDSAVSCDQKD